MSAVLGAWVHRRMAMLATLFGRSEVALAHWRAVCRLRPRDAMAVATVGHLLAEQGRRDDAIAALEASLAIDANLATVWFNLGFLQQERDDHLPALASFDR
ncbi:MAG: tetratricopeptide repeat protein, partial [Rubrivivax sp.]